MNHPETLLYTILVLLCSAGYTWSIHHFCASHFTCIKQRKIPFLFLLPLGLSISNTIILLGILPYPVGLLCSPLWQFLLTIWIILLYKGMTMQKILASAFLLTISLLIQNCTGSFSMILLLAALHVLHIELTPVINYALDCLTCCIMAACTISGITFLTRQMKGFFANRLHRWYIMLCVPLFGIIILWNLIYIGASHGILLRGGDHLNLYYNELFSHAGICILSALCLCGIGFYMFGMDKIDIEQKQKEQYRSQVAFYQMLEEQYRSLERLRHDMKNHIIGLQQLIDNHEWDKMTDYLHKLADTGDIEYTDELTGKSIVDALLYYKHNQAKENHIRWECDTHIPPDCPIDDFDLCVIFGNLLDNALEACQNMLPERERFITIQAHMVKKCLLIEMVNSAKITARPVKELETAKYSGNTAHHIISNQIKNTQKPAYKKNGIGLRNVKDAINKYNGTLSIDTNAGIFRVSILIPCVMTTHDINP